MLTPHLAQMLANLEKKRNRTNAEEGVYNELRALNINMSTEVLGKSLTESKRTSSFGPQENVCGGCGRAF